MHLVAVSPAQMLPVQPISSVQVSPTTSNITCANALYYFRHLLSANCGTLPNLGDFAKNSSKKNKNTILCIVQCWRSSMVEPWFCKPVVVGSSPIASSTELNKPSFGLVFLYLDVMRVLLACIRVVIRIAINHKRACQASIRVTIRASVRRRYKALQ